MARAIELVRLSGARLLVVTVGDAARSPVAPDTQPAAASTGTDFQADVALDAALGRLGADDLAVEQHVVSGDPPAQIVALARREGADLIVVGSQGMRGAGRMLGSVPNKVSHRAPCDVLIVQTD